MQFLGEDRQFKIQVLGGALVGCIGLAWLRFAGAVALPTIPPPPNPPKVSAAQVSKHLEKSQGAFGDYLSKDLAQYNVKPAVTVEQLGLPITYQQETPQALLDPKDNESLDVLDLRLTVDVASPSGTPYRQMILSIQNTSDKYLAYRIVTSPTIGKKPCRDKKDLVHNAIALAPGETVKRSECIFHKDWRLTVQSVEIMEINQLSYFYLSSVPPARLGLDDLVTAGHKPPSLAKMCDVLNSADVERAYESGQIAWRDFVDFYARHRCQTYSFPVDYRSYEGAEPMQLPTGAIK